MRSGEPRSSCDRNERCACGPPMPSPRRPARPTPDPPAHAEGCTSINGGLGPGECGSASSSPSFTFPGGPAAIRSPRHQIAQGAEANGFASLRSWTTCSSSPRTPDSAVRSSRCSRRTPPSGSWPPRDQRIALGPMVERGAPDAGAAGQGRHDAGRARRRRSTYFAVGAGWYERESTGLGLPVAAARAAPSNSRRRCGSHRRCSRATGPRSRAAIIDSPSRSTCRRRCRARGSWSVVAANEASRGQYADACNILVPDPGESRASSRSSLSPLRGDRARHRRDRDDLAARGGPPAGSADPGRCDRRVPGPGRRGHRARDREPARRLRTRTVGHVRARDHPGRRLTAIDAREARFRRLGT